MIDERKKQREIEEVTPMNLNVAPSLRVALRPAEREREGGKGGPGGGRLVIHIRWLTHPDPPSRSSLYKYTLGPHSAISPAHLITPWTCVNQ